MKCTVQPSRFFMKKSCKEKFTLELGGRNMLIGRTKNAVSKSQSLANCHRNLNRFKIMHKLEQRQTKGIWTMFQLHCHCFLYWFCDGQLYNITSILHMFSELVLIEIWFSTWTQIAINLKGCWERERHVSLWRKCLGFQHFQ